MDDDDYNDPSNPGLSRWQSSRPHKPNTSLTESIGYEEKKNSKLKSVKEIKTKCEQILDELKQSIFEFNSSLPSSVKIFDTANFDKFSKKLSFGEYKGTYEFALDIRSMLSGAFQKLLQHFNGSPEVSNYYSKLSNILSKFESEIKPIDNKSLEESK